MYNVKSRRITGKFGIFFMVTIFVVMLFMLMFLAIPETAIRMERTAERLGVSIVTDTSIPAIASAWTPPTGGSGYNFDATHQPANLNLNANAAIPVSSPDAIANPGTGFNKARSYGNCKGPTVDSITAFKCESNSTSAFMHHLFYRDYVLGDTMKAGFKNDLIDTISFTMNMTWSLGFPDNGGSIQENYFIALGTSSQETPTLISFTSLAASAVIITKEVRDSSNGDLSASRTVTLSRNTGGIWNDILGNSTSTLVMRVGLFAYITPNRSFWGAGVNWPTVDFQNPTATALSIAWTKPSLNVNVHAANNYGTINATNQAYVNKAAPVTVNSFDNNPMTFTAVATTPTANTITGYYFSGWTSSQTIRFSNRALTFSIRGACDLPKGANTYTANFRSYSLTGAETSYEYAQLNGVSVKQGPAAPTANPMPSEVAIGGLQAKYRYTSTGGYDSTEKPVNVSAYTLTVNIQDPSNNFYNATSHIYAFNITPLSITGKNLNLVGTYNFDGTDHQFVNGISGNKVSPSSFTFSHNSTSYTMNRGTDYLIEAGAHFGTWVNATNNPYVIANPSQRPGITLSLSGTGVLGNFSGNINAYAEIEPIKMSTVSVAVDMADEIRARYNTIYTGFEIIPEVILIRLSFGGKEFKLIAHDPANSVPARKQLYSLNYIKYGEVESYPALIPYGVGNMDWMAGFFAIQTDTYANNTNPSTGVAGFSIKVVKANTNEHQNFVGDGGRTDTSNVSKYIKFNIPKRNVDDKWNNEINDVTIIGDYADVTNKPYVVPVLYNGAIKQPYVYYVLIKVANVRLYQMNFQGDYFWKDDAIAFFALSNPQNVTGDPSPPSTFREGGTVYSVVNAGTFVSGVSFAGDGKNNIDVICGGVVNIEASGSACVEGEFQLAFPITPKQLFSLDVENSPGGGKIANINDQTYNFNEQIAPNITARATFDFSEEGQANNGEVLLINNTDYAISYSNNEGITQEALVTLVGKGNYTGTITKTFNICALDITSNLNVTLLNLPNVTYTGAKFGSTSAILTVDAGINGTYEINSSEYSVLTSGANINAGPGSFTISLGGFVAGTPGVAGTGPKFAGQKDVAFTIIPKNINLGTIVKSATWVNYDPSLVTYDGNAKTNLPIVTTGTSKTIVLKDNDRSQIELTYSTVSASGDYMLALTNAWGGTAVAGIDSGTVKFIGINNYTGETIVPFQILQKSVSGLLEVTLFTGTGSGYNQALNGYFFTGSKIEPTVATVKIDRGTAGMLEISYSSDYSISYGSADPEKNVYAKKGGIVTITGIGNYKDTQTKTFNVLPIDQKVIFVNPTSSDLDIKIESITKVVGHTYYADFEINAETPSGRELTLEARTTAIYPTARLIKFTAFPSSSNITVSGITYTSCVLEEIEGITYSVTKAKIIITSEKRYGRIRVEAEQFDNETTNPVVTIGATEFRNLGNYNKCEYSPTNENNKTTYWFFLKKYDSLDSQYTNIIKTYGNNEISFPRNKLVSFLTTNPSIYSTISLISSNISIVSVAEATINWNVAVKNAGNCTLTLSHSGYVVNESSAYLAFSITIPVTIHPRNLEISFAPVTTTYGTPATFNYSYRTWATDQAKGSDGYVGLSYQSFSDIPSDIMSGMIINYNPLSTDELTGHKNSTSYIDNNVEKHNPYLIPVTLGQTQGSKYSNYNISSASGSLTVLRKALSASVSNVGQANVISKSYGEVNPVANDISYGGWISGETLEDLILQGVPFTAPTLSYQTQAGDPITQFTGIGTYTISLSGGTSENYSIPLVTVTCIIIPVTPQISLSSIATTYQAKSIGYPFNDFDEYLNPIVKQASVLPVLEGATTPKEGNVTYQYRYEQQLWSSDKPKRAGTYSTRVSYLAQGGDNYKDVTKDFLNNIVITKAVPTISLGFSSGVTQYVRNFTGQAIDPTTIQPTISGVGTDKPVGGNIIIKFRIAGETEWLTEVSAAGTYDLYIKFEALPTDNYTSYDNPDEPFLAVLLIKDGVVDIVLQDGCRVQVDFDGLNHNFDISKVKFLGSPTDLDEYGFRKIIAGTAEVTYSKQEGVWLSEAPLNAGIYAVSIKYTTFEGTNYEGNEIAFNKYNGQDLFVIYRKNIKDYMGVNLESAIQSSYDAEYHIIPSNLITLGKLANDLVGPTGTTTIGYQLSGTPTAPIIARVRDVGTYDVVLQYTEGADDNYTYTTAQRVQGRLVITAADVIINYASTYNVFDFTGDSHRVSVAMTGVKGEIPKGTLIYEYKLNGETTFTSNTPVNAGSYDIKVTYQRRIDIVDNYASTSNQKNNIIVINKISPVIIINDMILDYGVINAQYRLDVSLRGASRDLIGPPLTNNNGSSTLSYEYGVLVEGEYQWHQWTTSSFPVNSGKYSLRATYNPSIGTDSRNYLPATTVRFMCLEIKNIAPIFSLPSKMVYYSGASVPASSVVITNAGDLVPPGKISYEYMKQATFVWRNSPPQEVGFYDVRVKYVENPKGDSFSSFTKVFTGALEIRPLPITIVPLLGQGNVFGSSAVASSEIIYSYYYIIDGYKYFVSPAVFDAKFGENVDVSVSEYLAEDGYAYQLDMVDGVAFRDYESNDITILSSSFSYQTSSGAIVNEAIDYTGLVASNVSEFTVSGREYILDNRNGTVKHKNYFENTILTYSQRNGYFFSIVGSDGKVENTEIIERRITWLNTERTIGNFEVVKDGYPVRYTVNFAEMKVIQGNKVYPIKTSSGYISYSVDNNQTLLTVLIDEGEVYNRNLQNNTAYYRAVDGYVYEISFDDNKAIRMYPVNIEEIQFTYEKQDAVTGETESVTVSLDIFELSSRYANQKGIYSYTDSENGLNFIINLNQMVALKDMRYKLISEIAGDYFEYKLLDGSVNRIYINNMDLVATDRKGVYLYTDVIYGHFYYIDTNTGIIRNAQNKVDFNPGTSVITYMKDGNAEEVAVNFHNIYFNTYNGGTLARRISLFGQKLSFTSPVLIVGNSWNGSIRAQLGGAGGYQIEKGTIAAGTNYIVNISGYGIKYIVDRAPIYVTFTGPTNNIYNGMAKTITYEVFGFIGNDNEEVLGLMETLEGDNVAATPPTSNGFRLRLSLDPNNRVAANYDLMNSFSQYFFINPAVMETITFTPIPGGIVYDGQRHELKLANIDSSYTIKYNGRDVIPSFVNPGTYPVTAIVTKDNYIPQIVPMILTIKKAIYTVTPDPVTKTLHYGDNLPVLTCGSDHGTVRFIAGQYLHPAIVQYHWEFIPHRTDFYDFYQGLPENNYLVKGTVSLNVQKAKPSLQLSGLLVQDETTPSALQPLINGKSDFAQDVTVSYKAVDGTVYTSLPTDPGKYTVVVEYLGDELYQNSSLEMTLTIKAKNNITWIWIFGGAMGGLALLSALFFIIRKQKTYV